MHINDLRNNDLPPPVPETEPAAATLIARRLPGRTVITLHGEIDIATSPDLRERLNTALNEAAGPVIIDLSGVVFCDANGLALLIAARRRAHRNGLGEPALAAPRPQLAKLLRITGLDGAFTVQATVADALAQGGPQPRRAAPTAVA